MKKYINVDGNTAASNIAYYFSEIASIYPITPSSTMAELVDEWSQTGKKNLFGMPVKVEQLQSEAGAAGATHGSLIAGALATTFTASQGLLLMIPNMLKIAGELLPTVFHVSARAVATHALSIFGDHSDVMQCRSTGFCMIASSSVQEAQDMAIISHISALKSSLPFLHFFDGFRTSHEVQKIEAVDEEILKQLTPFDKIQEFKAKCLNPSHPSQYGTAQNPDIFFQNREACSPFYDKVYDIVAQTMNDFAQKTNRKYSPFEYIGKQDAENIIVVMGSGAETIEETISDLDNVGMIKIRLYRPFNASAFVSCLPKTAKNITILDRTKESGSIFEPLALDVISALALHNIKLNILAGRYGIGGKEFTPQCVKAVVKNMLSQNLINHFTVGIVDDVSHSSLPIDECEEIKNKSIQLKFFGLGGDGTVSANKNAIKIIGENTKKFTQGYFEYDSKKSRSLTISHLRISDFPIKSAYTITHADFIAIHNFNFVSKYDILKDLKKNGTVLLNTSCSEQDLNKCLPQEFKSALKQKQAKLYILDAQKIAEEIGLGNKINTIMQSAFFKVSNIIDFEQAKIYMKHYAQQTYGKKGDDVVKTNFKAIEQGYQNITTVDISKFDSKSYEIDSQNFNNDYFQNFINPINKLQGNSLPVSRFNPNGQVPTDTTKFEKRGIASKLPCWQNENCIQCGMCVAVCPHSALKSAIITEKNLDQKPSSFKTSKAIGCDGFYKLQLSPLDCTGCGVCSNICPAKQKALIMKPANEILEDEKQNYTFFEQIKKDIPNFNKNTTKGLQFQKSYFQYNYACAGCGETPYIKLVSQMFGENMLIANATGCSSIYGGSAPACPFSRNQDGCGPAWANSLFEDNAEFGLGLSFAIQSNKARLHQLINQYLPNTSGELYIILKAWLDNKNNCSNADAKKIITLLKEQPESAIQKQILSLSDYLAKKSIWIVGGDGWAYDIGYGGLDHVLNSTQNVNILVLDTEVYSNTGGQSSKATPRGSFAKFAFGGKNTKKKDLGMLAVANKNCYVASVGLGANIQQCINAFKEAEEFEGPSIILAYSPCVNHGFDMSQSQQEIKRAVASGYWNLYRFNPTTNKFFLDSPAPTLSYEDFLLGETRYSSLLKKDQSKAKKLFKLAQEDAMIRYKELEKMANKI